MPACEIDRTPDRGAGPPGPGTTGPPPALGPAGNICRYLLPGGGGPELTRTVPGRGRPLAADPGHRDGQPAWAGSGCGPGPALRIMIFDSIDSEVHWH